MTPHIARRQTPEEKELEAKLQQLAELQETLAQSELDLATLRGELRDFERKYFSVVGVKYAELDEIEAQIAEHLASETPEDATVEQEAQEARTKADESARAAGEAVPGEQMAQKPPPSPELKKLYREVAKLVHPDRANDDEADRKRREALMTEANKAYEEGDSEQLRAILEQAEHSPEAVRGEDTGARLIRVIRQISLAQKWLHAVKEQIEAAQESDLFKLRKKVLEASAESRDLLEEMAAHLDAEIASAKERLASLT